MIIGWVTSEEVQARYGDDAPQDPVTLQSLLQAAYELCLEYVDSEVPSPLPERYKLAQMIQAKDMWTADRSNGEGIGSEGFVIPTFPMSWHIKNLLQPRKVIGPVG